MTKWIFLLLVVLGMGVAVFGFVKYRLLWDPMPQKGYHTHIDIVIAVNGEPLDLSQAKYQESETNPLDPGVHMHDGNGKVLHFHEEGVTLKRYLTSIGMNPDDPLVVVVNGLSIADRVYYQPMDLDKILISFGSPQPDELLEQFKMVSNEACIYSEKCPERGKPPVENCVGGLGSSCEL